MWACADESGSPWLAGAGYACVLSGSRRDAVALPQVKALTWSIYGAAAPHVRLICVSVVVISMAGFVAIATL